MTKCHLGIAEQWKNHGWKLYERSISRVTKMLNPHETRQPKIDSSTPNSHILPYQSRQISCFRSYLPESSASNKPSTFSSAAWMKQTSTLSRFKWKCNLWEMYVGTFVFLSIQITIILAFLSPAQCANCVKITIWLQPIICYLHLLRHTTQMLCAQSHVIHARAPTYLFLIHQNYHYYAYSLNARPTNITFVFLSYTVLFN